MNYHSFQALGSALQQYQPYISSVSVSYLGDEGPVSKTIKGHGTIAPLETELYVDGGPIELEALASVHITLKSGEELFF